MITDWRQKFHLPELSFFFVQLAAYSSDYSLIRQAQMAALKLPLVGYGTAIDIGDPTSPQGNIHPRRKQEVGRRLSLSCRAIQYVSSVFTEEASCFFLLRVVELYFGQSCCCHHAFFAGVTYFSLASCVPPPCACVCVWPFFQIWRERSRLRGSDGPGRQLLWGLARLQRNKSHGHILAINVRDPALFWHRGLRRVLLRVPV